MAGGSLADVLLEEGVEGCEQGYPRVFRRRSSHCARASGLQLLPAPPGTARVRRSPPWGCGSHSAL